MEVICKNLNKEFYNKAVKANTDKVSTHHYHLYYPKFIRQYKELSAGYGMVEIGCLNKDSLNLWLDYFPNAYVYGVDIGYGEKGNRYEIIKADQSCEEDLKKVMTAITRPIFFINDDGSHIPEHQILTFEKLFYHILQPGGTYIIEDIETSYWTHNGLYGYSTNYGYKHPNSIIEIFKEVADDVNQLFLTESNKNLHNDTSKLSTLVRNQISTITFARNCIIITKKTTEELNSRNGKYPYESNL